MSNKRYALGFIETCGLVSVLEAADAMCKAADVELIGYENTASVGAVQQAVDAGVKRAEEVGPVYSHIVIPNPHPEIEKIVEKYALDW